MFIILFIKVNSNKTFVLNNIFEGSVSLSFRESRARIK